MSLPDLTSQPSPQAGPSRPSRYAHAHANSTYTHVSTPSFASSSSTPNSTRDARFPLPGPGPGPGPVPPPVLPPGSAPTHVQAIHDFDPKRLASTSQANPHMYLCFRAGDVIRVYSRDERGWWDGEVANATEEREGPRRGWFPSNYVREMSWDGALHRRNESTSTAVSVGSPMSHRNHDRKSSIASHHSLTSSSSGPSPTIRSFPTLPPSFQPILVPIVQSLSLLEASISSRRRTHFQPSTACVISAIRSALAEADCLSKESDTLTRWPVLAKERKLVLVELSRLVTCARDASGTGTAEGEETAQVGSVEELGKAARNVFESVQKFFAMAAELGVQPKPQRAGPEQKPEQAEVNPKPPFPPVAAQKKRSPTAQSSTSISSGSTASTRPSRVRSPPPSNPRMQEAFRKATSVGDLRAARRRASSPPPPLPTAPALMSRGTTQSPSPSSTPMSLAFGSSSSSGRSSPAVTKSTHVRRVQGSMDSTVSHASSDAFGLDDTAPASSEPGHSHSSRKRLSTLEEVLKAIQLAEERLFSIIAALVGHVHAHHHHAHPSSHALLIETTRETVDSIRELLTVVEAVGRHDGVRAVRPAEVDRLRVIKDELYDVASQLVESAEVVANAPFDLPEAEEKDYARQKSQLLNATTSTLRKSSECLRAVRLCVPQDEAELEDTPRPDDHVDPRQATPRPADHGASLRVNAVGARGLHTLSGLHRKATSLSQLQKRYQHEVGFGQAPEEDTEEEDNDDEEVVADMGRDEDVTLRPTAPFPVYGSRPGLMQTQSSPGLLRTPRPESGESAFGVRSRSSSLTSPAPPSRMGHRSPSRSADLDRFTSDMDVRVDIRRPSTASSTTTSMSQSSAVSSRVSEQWGESGGSASALGFPSGPSSRSSANAVPSISFDAVRNSATSSNKTGDAPQTPETTEDSPMLGYLRDEEGAAPEMMPRIGTLRIDTDATPIKPAGAGFAFPRPPMERSATAPLPVHLAQAQDRIQAPQSHSGARFWAVAHDYDPREISFNPEGAIIGASLRVVVEKMTPHDGPVDTTFSATFWYTFRLFTSPMTLLEEMIRRYDLQPPPGVAMAEGERALWIERKVVPVRLRIYNFLKAWLDTHWRSETDDLTLPTLRAFASDVVSRTLPAMAPRLLDAIQRRSDPTSAISSRSSLKRSSSSDRLRFMSPTSFVPPAQTSLPPTPIISKSLHSLLQKTSASAGANATRIPITDFDTTELARQLTLTEWKLFAAVEPEDLLHTGRKAIPELKALSTLSNQITGWVADGILNEQDSKKRAGLLKFYIKLADKCLALNNFSTLFAILAGLNSSTILRLKKTWDALPSKYRVTMDRLRGVIEHTKNHAAYRARLREVTGPCLPFLGLILTDITFTSDGNADTRPSVLAPEMSLINQDKYNKLGKIALDFVRYQEPFTFHELDAVQAWLQRVLAERGSSSLDALYRKSLMLEPRSGAERPSLVVEKPGWLGVRGLAGGMAALG